MPYDRDLADRLRDVLAPVEVTEKAMFGGLAFLVGGHMAVAAGSHGGMLLRVRPERSAALLDDPRAEPMVMQGREMRGWLSVDTADLADDELGRWVDEGLAAALVAPPGRSRRESPARRVR